ncbi:MAG: RluA family pseudouridine synthase [Myxococcales bacterium]|jgi:23S rRNA pseudouridine1911/1915/1917 synthase|nr:RluA family pseudouridine synthase [Myxococcales bacterium]
MITRLVWGPSSPKGRIDKVLADELPGVTRATVQRWIEEGRVRIDGRPCRARDRVDVGSVIEVEPGPPPPSRAEPDASVELNVLHEDPHLLVIEKQAGLVVHPGRGHMSGTLVNGLLARPGFSQAPADPRDPAGALRPGIVHRIDKDTSGVLVVAKSAEAREGLKAQLSEHTVERVYRALTVGVPVAGTIETLHGRDPSSRLRFTSRVLRGRRAVTHVAPLEVLAAGRAALVECRLETGRTHQIRVHLSERAGTPILADALYGGKRGAPEVVAIGEELGRHALHAAVLGFTHPVTGQSLRFETPLPSDMQAALENLRRLG